MRRLTPERLRQALHYDPNTGVFTWCVERRGPKTKNRIAGSIAGSKYRIISIDGERFPASHLAWMYMTGQWPDGLIDHINQNKIDDRWCNLREADHSTNRANTGLRSSNTSGIKGVHFDRRFRKWAMQIRCRDQIIVSHHPTAEEAAAEYNRQAVRLFGEFAAVNDLQAIAGDGRQRNSGNTKTKRINRERVRRWYATHVGCHQVECATGLGLSPAAVYRHIKDLRAEWQSTQNSILDLYKVVTE